MSFGAPADDNNGEMSEINMTPLIDVMLVLLIIFIITMPILTHSVKVDLPQASNQPSTEKPDIITLSIDKAGQIFWDDILIDEKELELRLQASSAKTPQPEVHIRGDKKVEYEHMIRAMAAAQRAGIAKLGFITEPGG